jgi:hypothetical protein
LARYKYPPISYQNLVKPVLISAKWNRALILYVCVCTYGAVMAEETGILEDSRRFAKMSLCASFLGVCGGIVLMIILVAVFVSGGGTVAGMTGAGAVGVVAGANAESNPGPGGPMPQDDAGHGMASYVTGGPTAAGRYPGMNTMQFAASHREHAVRRAQRVLHPVVKQAAPSVRQRDRQVPFQQPIDVPRSDPQVSQIRYNYDKLSVDLQ